MIILMTLNNNRSGNAAGCIAGSGYLIVTIKKFVEIVAGFLDSGLMPEDADRRAKSPGEIK